MTIDKFGLGQYVCTLLRCHTNCMAIIQLDNPNLKIDFLKKVCLPSNCCTTKEPFKQNDTTVLTAVASRLKSRHRCMYVGKVQICPDMRLSSDAESQEGTKKGQINRKTTLAHLRSVNGSSARRPSPEAQIDGKRYFGEASTDTHRRKSYSSLRVGYGPPKFAPRFREPTLRFANNSTHCSR